MRTPPDILPSLEALLAHIADEDERTTVRAAFMAGAALVAAHFAWDMARGVPPEASVERLLMQVVPGAPKERVM